MDVIKKITNYEGINELLNASKQAREVISIAGDLIFDGTVSDIDFKTAVIETLLDELSETKPELINELYDEIFGKENIDG